MTQCWSEGALRAYLDRELPPEEIQRAAAHLKECTVCDGLCNELAARAAQVGELLDLLPELEVETIRVPLRMPRRVSAWQRAGWAGAAVAVAAGLGIVAYFAPHRQEPQVNVALAPPPAPAPVVTRVVPEIGPERPAVSVRPARNAVRRARTVAQEGGDFVALDDQPFESGVVMRMAITPGKLQADVVFDPDGRARAFRLVKAPQQRF